MRTRLTLKDLNGEVYGPLILMLSSMQIMYRVENEWLTECMIIAHNVKKHKLGRDQNTSSEGVMSTRAPIIWNVHSISSNPSLVLHNCVGFAIKISST